MSKDKLKTDDLDDFQKLYESMRSDEEDDEEDEDFESVIGGGKYLVRYTLINDDDEEVRTKEICGVIDEDAARENSTCPSKDNGGNLGEFTKGQMVPEFDEAVFSMEVGTISAPVKTQFGYHLIKLISKSEASTYAFDEIKAQLTDMVNQEKKQNAFQSKINQLKILYPVDKF